MIDQIDKHVYLALLAEKAGSYQDMRFYLEKYILNSNHDITVDERNLLSVAYKHLVSTKRHCVRTLLAKEMKEKQNKKSEELDYIREYKKRLEEDLVQTSVYICEFITNYLIPNAEDPGAKTFYHKLIGDYNRYIAENIDNELREEYSKKSSDAYKIAYEISKQLKPIDPVRLGLALNFSVYSYEIVNNQEAGCQIAKEALESVKKDLETLDENDDKNVDIFNVIELIQENLNMWNIESEH